MHKKFRNKKIVKNILLFSLSGFIFITAFAIIYLTNIKIPDFRSFEDRKMVSSTKIYDSTGTNLLYDIHQDVKRTNITFEEMGDNIKNATVAIEDADFYNHHGIKITSIFRAILSNVFNVGKTQGGSTITQQLVKNTLLNSKKTIGRKIKEWVLAVKIDKVMSKEKILEFYLNENPYGGTVYGVQEAAKTYFNKDAKDLTLAEAAYLASIPQSPSVLSPYGKNKKRLDDRKNLVLSRMLAVKLINQQDYEKAKAEVVVFQPQSTGNIKAPHFVFFIKEYLEQKYGVDTVENGGLKVTTTLNFDLQQKAEAIVKEGALKNAKDWNGTNASLVAIDPKTGGILAMVGSRDYFDKEIDGNFNVATAERQPGSSFKPFIYATAFMKGFTPDSVLFDVPTEFSTGCSVYGKPLAGHSKSDCYMPDNYDGKFRGPMSLRNALAQSINIPAVKLFYLAGIKDSFKTSESMGISTLTDPSRYGLTLVIGGGEVSLLDITSAYGVFANNGVRNPYTGILKVEDSNGKVLEEYTQNTREVLPKNVALTISDILSDNIARVPTFGANSPLVVPGHAVAVKTGTTNSNKDAWTIGYTPSVSVGVWAGNNNNKPMKKGGSALAGPIWNKFMIEALKVIPSDNFEKPDFSTDPETVKPVLRGYWQGNEHFFIDKFSGNLATNQTPREAKEEKVITNVHSILYWVNKNDITGNPPSNPGDDSQYEHWEIPVQNWWAQNRYKYPIVTSAQIPQGLDNTHDDASKPIIAIVSPVEGSSYTKTQNINLVVNSSGRFPLQKIDIFINDIYVDTTTAPFNFSFIPKDIENIQENNEMKIIAYDTAFNRTEAVAIFNITQ